MYARDIDSRWEQRRKCRSDRSLAIAHDLDDFYVEPPATVKKSRSRATLSSQLDDERE